MCTIYRKCANVMEKSEKQILSNPLSRIYIEKKHFPTLIGLFVPWLPAILLFPAREGGQRYRKKNIWKKKRHS